jgi:hypothetical protein
MKRLICFVVVFILFWLFTLRADAPPFKCLYIPAKEPIYIFGLNDPLVRSVAYHESRFNPYAVNKISGARGLMQITKIMIKEVNKICKKMGLPPKYTWKDAFDPLKSIDIWWIVQNYKNPGYLPDRACRIWFGTGRQYDGKRWEDYYNEVSKRL